MAPLPVILLALASAAAFAQPYSITSATVDAGGGTLAAGSYTLNGTIGQPDAGATLASNSFDLAGGFWPGVFATPSCPTDTNNDGILDNGDIGTFVSLFLAGSITADFNGDGILDNGDIGTFVLAFLEGC